MALEHPNRSMRGAFGCYMSEHRPALLKECAGKGAAAAIKLGSERFKALGPDERAKYEKMNEDAKKQYEEDMAYNIPPG